MPELKFGEPFGLPKGILAKIDWNLSLKRVIHDLRSDFVYAPHLTFLYRNAGDELIKKVTSELRSGKFLPGHPVTIEVPKSFRARVAVKSKQLGPPFSRPGSILMPSDRLFYQVLADSAAPIIKDKTDNRRSFSHRIASKTSSEMFCPARDSWNRFQSSLAQRASIKSISYIMKVDVANFFGTINQHILINVLNDYGYPSALSSRLELMLTSFTGERSSRGILQGLFPSDLFGNFYLAPVDRFLGENRINSVRYVDDVYIFVKNVGDADKVMRKLIPFLRTYDLTLNEAKAVVIPKNHFFTEEPDLEDLFKAAMDEVSEQFDDEDFGADYGFQSEWFDEEDDDNYDSIELKATKILFDSIQEYSGQEENIERFCIPLFEKIGSDYALQHVMDSFTIRPAMGQIYASYLADYVEDDTVRRFLIDMMREKSLTDWQKMWSIAALMRRGKAGDIEMRTALKILEDSNAQEALRAVAAIYVGRFGDLGRRKSLASIYTSVPAYTQAAIYYSSHRWPSVERRNARATWGKSNPVNALLSSGVEQAKL